MITIHYSQRYLLYLRCDCEFISIPKEMSTFHCGQFVAGMIEAVCDGSGFEAKVNQYNNNVIKGQCTWNKNRCFSNSSNVSY